MKQETKLNDITWVSLSEPSNKELAECIRDANLSPSDAQFVLQDRRRPEISIQSDYCLILIQVPVFDKKTRVTSGAALYFIIGKDRVWTIHYEPLVVLKMIMKDIQKHDTDNPETFGSPINAALTIIDSLNTSSFEKIDRLSKHIEIAEDAVFHGNERKMVEEVAILMRDVLDFRRVIMPQATLFRKVPDMHLSENEIMRWNRVSSQTQQLWEILMGLHDSTKELQNTNNSLLQHKENELLRLLTLYSTIAIPVWILVSPFSPLSPSPLHRYIFYSIIFVLVITLFGIFLSFKRKRVL